MKITVEKEYLEAKFPSQVKYFEKIDGIYEKVVHQDQMEIEFENENCKLFLKFFEVIMFEGFTLSYYLRGASSWFFGPGFS